MKMNKKQQGRGESYLERWRLLAAKEAAGVVFAPFLLLFLCFLLRCFFCFCYLPLFLCSALLVAVERKSNGGASGLKVAGDGSSSSPPSTPPLVFFLSVLFCFSSLLSGLCFLFLSPFSRLASLSVTALLSFSKILPLSFPPSYSVLPRLYL